jgi:hypothetical protein
VSVVAVTVAIASSAITPSTPAPISVKPRPGANEQSARKPAWPVIAVRCARVGRISVIAIRACRRSGNVSWPDSHTHTYPDLCLREGQWHHQHRQQRHILEITHFVPPCPDPLQSEASTYLNPGPEKSCRDRSG